MTQILVKLAGVSIFLTLCQIGEGCKKKTEPVGNSVKSRDFCQPGQECWPTKEEVDAFKQKLSVWNPENETDCHGLPTFSSQDEPGEKMINKWYPDHEFKMTPYELLNIRQKTTYQKGYFVVLARTESDIVESVLFANRHNLAVSVFSTGHEFNDRNGGPADNSLLIRTTCLRTAEVDVDPDNRFGWSDGVARLGSGMTWGVSKFGDTGVHQLAAKVGRTVVSGHAATISIVGWSLGGGHGQLVGPHGLGADQVVEVELIIADGSKAVANQNGTTITKLDGQVIEEQDNDLFWAVRGGGAGPWGIVTAMTIRLHRPIDGCKKDCNIDITVTWEGNWKRDDGEMGKEVIHNYLKWTGRASKYWNSYFVTIGEPEAVYKLVLMANLNVPNNSAVEELADFNTTFEAVLPNYIVERKMDKYDNFTQKFEAQDSEKLFTTELLQPGASVFLNKSMVNLREVSDMFMDTWVPRCYRNYGSDCTGAYLFMHTLPTGEAKDDYSNTDNAVSPHFRSAKVHVSTLALWNMRDKEVDMESAKEYVKEFLTPTLFRYGEGSYYSESDYTMDNWQHRYWTQENYKRLLKVKRRYDPDFRFLCPHCIGDGESKDEL